MIYKCFFGALGILSADRAGANPVNTVGLRPKINQDAVPEGGGVSKQFPSILPSQCNISTTTEGLLARKGENCDDTANYILALYDKVMTTYHVEGPKPIPQMPVRDENMSLEDYNKLMRQWMKKLTGTYESCLTPLQEYPMTAGLIMDHLRLTVSNEFAKVVASKLGLPLNSQCHTSQKGVGFGEDQIKRFACALMMKREEFDFAVCAGYSGKTVADTITDEGRIESSKTIELRQNNSEMMYLFIILSSSGLALILFNSQDDKADKINLNTKK